MLLRFAVIGALAGCSRPPAAAPAPAMSNTATGASADPASVRESPPAQMATLRFVIDPPDAIIEVEGQPAHTGSFELRVGAGLYRMKADRDGFKPYLTQIEIGGGETQTLRVVLEPDP